LGKGGGKKKVSIWGGKKNKGGKGEKLNMGKGGEKAAPSSTTKVLGRGGPVKEKEGKKKGPFPYGKGDPQRKGGRKKKRCYDPEKRRAPSPNRWEGETGKRKKACHNYRGKKTVALSCVKKGWTGGKRRPAF